MANRDTVRTMVGDPGSGGTILTDTQIDTFLTTYSVLDSSGGTTSVNIPRAAADCAGAIAAYWARDFDFSEDGQNFQRAQRVGHYLQLERDLLNRSGGIAVPHSGTTPTS